MTLATIVSKSPISLSKYQFLFFVKEKGKSLQRRGVGKRLQLAERQCSTQPSRKAEPSMQERLVQVRIRATHRRRRSVTCGYKKGFLDLTEWLIACNIEHTLLHVVGKEIYESNGLIS